ncbi:hypothetical protein GCM10011583_25630 [Streptomyces camponoticapitis]|uniref:Uncharacterized protein n=1 Tax=Streptomyces camponoticapitis TaxID=1616125 RepID=A0ABQ2E3K4_9ACTN|nr:hypothetical protein GCM10011583_25630 [Streptomyces camponoticapitis]
MVPDWAFSAETDAVFALLMLAWSSDAVSATRARATTRRRQVASPVRRGEVMREAWGVRGVRLGLWSTALQSEELGEFLDVSESALWP